MKNLFTLLLVVIIGTCTTTFSQTVTIGSQEWMTKNLDVSTFRNGDPIPQAKTDEEWVKAGENKQPAWCYYDNEPKNDETYGKLYNWYAVNDPRQLAPEGWHIPKDSEWIELTTFIGSRLHFGDWRDKSLALYAGKLMKSKEGWSGFGNGTDESLFNGKPGGMRGRDGIFLGSKKYGSWWTIDVIENDKAKYYYMTSKDDWIVGHNTYCELGLSVRCVKD